jgi:hypothetical protein
MIPVERVTEDLFPQHGSVIGVAFSSGQVLTLVHPVGALLASRLAGVGRVSVCVAATAPVRLFGVVVSGVLELIWAIVMLPVVLVRKLA